MHRLAARRRGSWVLRLRSHSANAHTVPRTQTQMTRLRLVRACCGISKDNRGTELSFSDIVSSYASERAPMRWHDRGLGVEAAPWIHTPRQHVTRGCLTADEMSA